VSARALRRERPVPTTSLPVLPACTPQSQYRIHAVPLSQPFEVLQATASRAERARRRLPVDDGDGAPGGRLAAIFAPLTRSSTAARSERRPGRCTSSFTPAAGRAIWTCGRAGGGRAPPSALPPLIAAVAEPHRLFDVRGRWSNGPSLPDASVPSTCSAPRGACSMPASCSGLGHFASSGCTPSRGLWALNEVVSLVRSMTAIYLARAPFATAGLAARSYEPAELTLVLPMLAPLLVPPQAPATVAQLVPSGCFAIPGQPSARPS